MHTANATLASDQSKREVPPLTTYRFYLCDLTVPPPQPAPIAGGKAIEPHHTHHNTHTHIHTHSGCDSGCGGGYTRVHD